MRFINHSSRDIWLGAYNTSDHQYILTLFPFGSRVRVKAGESWGSDAAFALRVQVTIWESALLGSVISQPRTVYTNYDISFAEDVDGTHIYNGSELPTVVLKIQHVFVLMLENRSFDHLLGWLYEDQNNQPPRNIPAQYVPTYDGLKEGKFWNTRVAAEHDGPIRRVYAQKAAAGTFTKPDPNPPEICPRFVEQMFGTETPSRTAQPNMTGFIQAYAKRDGGNADPDGIMESYTPEHLPNLSKMAREFAVCDRWFGSLPCMTYPNRSFLHAGTSFGRLNNMNGKYSEGDFPDPLPNVFDYAGKRTIFDELDDVGIPFGLYTSSEAKITLLGAQFFTVPQKVLRPFKHLRDLSTDLNDMRVHQLPWYTFIEPEYIIGANDQHPPLDIRAGDNLIGEIFDIINKSPVWRKSVLIVTYDEHGGCFDHVPPPAAVRPDSSLAQFAVGEIDPFQIYGPRVPAVIASPHIKPGTVFRNPETPHDHTSVLSTLRDMVFPYGGATSFFERNNRIATAPTIWGVFQDDGDPAAAACDIAVRYLLATE